LRFAAWHADCLEARVIDWPRDFLARMLECLGKGNVSKEMVGRLDLLLCSLVLPAEGYGKPSISLKIYFK
jgi:hypothetical protein